MWLASIKHAQRRNGARRAVVLCGFPSVWESAAGQKVAAISVGIFIPHSIGNAIFARLERILNDRLDFINFSLPGVLRTRIQIA